MNYKLSIAFILVLFMIIFTGCREETPGLKTPEPPVIGPENTPIIPPAITSTLVSTPSTNETMPELTASLEAPQPTAVFQHTATVNTISEYPANLKTRFFPTRGGGLENDHIVCDFEVERPWIVVANTSLPRNLDFCLAGFPDNIPIALELIGPQGEMFSFEYEDPIWYVNWWKSAFLPAGEWLLSA